MKGYYYSKLTNREQGYYQKVLKAMECGDSIVKSSLFMSSEVIKKIITAVNYDHPELFFVDFRHLNFITNSMGITYQIRYHVKFSLRQIVIDKMEQKIKEILDMVYAENMKSDYEKCRWVHNYLVKNIRYNYDALTNPDNYTNSFGINGVFIDKLAVCEGISKAFKILCDRLGVDTLIAFGTAYSEQVGAEVSHAWNLVNLEGEYSHIDVTWDIGMSEPSKYIRFDYFCISDKYMKIDHNYQELPECKTDKFSYFYKRNRCFINSNQLQEYLDSELKKGALILYFRVEKKNMNTETLQKKIQEQVEKTIIRYCQSSYYMEMIPNKKQLCFFFRIIR